MAQQENELKYELSRSAYEGLLSLLSSAGHPLRFFNSYFVVAEDTGRQDWVLRLRYSMDGARELTLKVGKETSPGTFRSTEYTTCVDSLQPMDWEGTEPMRIFREQISAFPLVHQGEAVNERHLVRAPFGPVPVWEVDRTTLPGGAVFQELEIEYPPELDPTEDEIAALRGELEGWMSGRGWPVVASRKTKYRRFLDSLSDPSG